MHKNASQLLLQGGELRTHVGRVCNQWGVDVGKWLSYEGPLRSKAAVAQEAAPAAAAAARR